MGENSKIEWCDHTLNFWIGCQEVSPACDHCYARVQNEHRKWVDGWGPHGERRRTAASTWHNLRKWNRVAGEAGVRARVFSNSLSDFFDNKAHPTWRREAWHFIEQSPNLDFLILTKRPQNILSMLPDPETGVKPWGSGWPNVWLGCTAENQEELARRIPHLAAVPAKVRFLSCEPLLGPIDLKSACSFPGRDYGERLIDWIICGGESGPGARPMHPEWVRGLRYQCDAADIPYFFKQHGAWLTFDARSPCFRDDGSAMVDGRRYAGDAVRKISVDTVAVRVGKKAAGALLDGCVHHYFPVSASN